MVLKEKTTPLPDRFVKTVRDILGIDLMHYGFTGLLGRLNERLSATGCKDFVEYSFYLKVHDDEVPKLFNALTINFTSFFRDLKSYQCLEFYLRELIHEGERPISVWSCGCSSGEELYSVGIMLSNLKVPLTKTEIGLYGTDIDEDALNSAHEGIYKADQLRYVTEEDHKKFFDEENGSFRISKALRKITTLVPLDILHQVGFSGCHVILCRNLLIYLSPQAQESVLLKLYQSLRPGGVLMIGMTEVLKGTAIQLFEHVNPIFRIFRKPRNVLFQTPDQPLSQRDIDELVHHLSHQLLQKPEISGNLRLAKVGGRK